jgi:hypothetical protein
VIGALLGIVIVLIGTIVFLAWGRSVARRERAAADTERTTVQIHLKGATDDLERERAAHERTQAALTKAQKALVTQQAQLDQVRREIGVKESKLKEVSGRVETIFKKRIMVKGTRPGPDTKIDGKVVDNLMLTQGWPALRMCYPLTGPWPSRLRVDVWVQPDGKVSDVGHSDEGKAKDCVTQALRRLRFPSFAGAHFVRIFYVFQGPAKKR